MIDDERQTANSYKQNYGHFSKKNRQRYRVIFFTDRKVNVNYRGSNNVSLAETSARGSLGFTICEINFFLKKKIF